MNCVILYRVHDGPVELVRDAAENVFEFPNIDAAVLYAESNSLFNSEQASFQIVELDEL